MGTTQTATASSSMGVSPSPLLYGPTANYGSIIIPCKRHRLFVCRQITKCRCFSLLSEALGAPTLRLGLQVMYLCAVYSIFKVHEAAPDCGWERTPSLTLNKEAIFEGVFQKKLEKFFGPLGKQKSRPSENGKAALRLNDLLVHIYIVYCGQAYGRRARAMTNGSNRSKEIISRLGLSSRTFCFITNYGQFRRKRG